MHVLPVGAREREFWESPPPPDFNGACREALSGTGRSLQREQTARDGFLALCSSEFRKGLSIRTGVVVLSWGWGGSLKSGHGDESCSWNKSAFGCASRALCPFHNRWEGAAGVFRMAGVPLDLIRGLPTGTMTEFPLSQLRDVFAKAGKFSSRVSRCQGARGKGLPTI